MVLAVSKDRYAVRAYVVGQAEPREIAAPSGWAARDWFQTMWNTWSTLDGLLPVHTIELVKNGKVLRGVTQLRSPVSMELSLPQLQVLALALTQLVDNADDTQEAPTAEEGIAAQLLDEVNTQIERILS